MKLASRTAFMVLAVCMCLALPAHAQTKGDIQAGDLLFKPASTAMWTQIAAEYSEGDKRWGHIGVVTAVEGAAIWVTHADTGELDRIGHVITESYDRFLGRATHIGHFRLDLSAPQRAAFITNLQQAANDRMPFDRGYDLSSPNNAYCTELVWRAWTAAKAADPLPKKLTRFGKTYIALSDISQHHNVVELGIIAGLADTKTAPP